MFLTTMIISTKAILVCASITLAAPMSAQNVTETQQDSITVDSLFLGQDYELGEVTVTAQRKLVKAEIDKTTYDVEHDKESKTKNILEILRKVPLVTVDAQENVKIKGSSSFKVYRNGHPDPSFQGSTLKDILKAIPASTIKKIEVITDPGAKEDAEGTQYILNIVMLSNSQFGGVMANLYTNVNTLTGETGEGAFVTAQMGKLVVSANYGYQFTKQESEGDFDIVYKTNGQRLKQLSDVDAKVNVHYGNINASYDIDSLNLATVSFGGYYYTAPNISMLMRNTAYEATGNMLYKYDNAILYDKYGYYNFNGRFDYQHKTHLDGEVLTASYMLSTTRSRQNQADTFQNMQNMPVAYTGHLTNTTENFLEQTFQVDYVRPFGKMLKWEVGAKYINRNNKSDVAQRYVGNEDMNQNTQLHHLTQVAAAYTEGILSLGKWSARAGVRYEYTHINAKYPLKTNEDFKKRLSDWVPSASLRYSFNETQSIKLSYSTSINRPGISYLNPAVIQNVSSMTYGNPDLNSSRQYSYNLDYHYFTPKLSFEVGPFLSYSNNQITSLNFLKDNTMVTTYCDYMHFKSIGAWLWCQMTPWKGSQITLNLSAQRNIFQDLPAQLSLGKWGGWASVNYSQTLFWKLNLGLFAGASLGHDAQNTTKLSGTTYYSLVSLQRSFLKDDRLTLSVAFNDIIGPHYKKWTSQYVQGDYTGYDSSGTYNKAIRLSASIRLGRIKASVKTVDKSIENNDVVGGLGKSTSKK